MKRQRKTTRQNVDWPEDLTYEAYRTAIYTESKPLFLKPLNENRKENAEVLENLLLNRKGSRKFSVTHSRDERHLWLLLHGFLEIELCLEILDDVPRYLSRFPIDIGDQSKTRYFEYHIGNYFNEIYILYERMSAYKKRVVRAYGNKKKDKELSLTVDELLRSFEKILTTRGQHVHERRYGDDDLLRLSILEMTNNILEKDKKFEKYVVKDQVRKIKRKWIKTISENKMDINVILNGYFGFLTVPVFEKNKKVIYPKSGIGKKIMR